MLNILHNVLALVTRSHRRVSIHQRSELAECCFEAAACGWNFELLIIQEHLISFLIPAQMSHFLGRLP